MSESYTVAGRSMTLESCISCGVEFTLPSALHRECVRVGKGKSFYCPNGHPMVFGEGTVDKLRRESDRLRQQLAEKDDEIALQRSNALAAQKEAERLKLRIGKGTCPCCNRHFSNLERHMKTKHGDKVVPINKMAGSK